MQKSSKSKKKWFGKQKLEISEPDTNIVSDKAPPQPPPPLPPAEEIKSLNIKNEDIQVHDVEVATSVNAETSVPAVQTAEVAIRAARIARFAGKSKEEVAAISIQTAFRGYLVCLD